jgi:hypothetical protein
MQSPKLGIVRSQLVANGPKALFQVNSCERSLAFTAKAAQSYLPSCRLAAIGARSLMGAGSSFDDSEETSALKRRLEDLREKHRELDENIQALQSDGVVDALQIARLKKEKLALKDQMAWIEDQLMPDIIA